MGLLLSSNIHSPALSFGITRWFNCFIADAAACRPVQPGETHGLGR